MSFAISATNITYQYPLDSSCVLDNITMKIPHGAFVFIKGPSGSGKTTLLKALYGEIKCQQGELSVCGLSMKNIQEKHLRLLRQHLGIVFQDYKLIDEWTIEENIILPLKIQNFSKQVCKSQAEKLLSHVKLLHKRKRYPFELSGGEQQRVGLARAMAHNPLLIIADEPTGNLDEYSSEVIWGLLANINQQLGTTVIVTTHQTRAFKDLHYLEYHLKHGKCMLM